MTASPHTDAPAVAPRLIVVDGPGKGSVFPLTQPRLVAGRGNGCPIRLADPKVSREHAAFLLAADGTVTVERISTTMPVFLNGQQVEQATLKDGDKVTLFPFTLELSLPHPEAPEDLGRTLPKPIQAPVAPAAPPADKPAPAAAPPPAAEPAPAAAPPPEPIPAAPPPQTQEEEEGTVMAGGGNGTLAAGTPPPPAIQVIKGPEEGLRIELKEERNVIGRSELVPIRLIHPKVSRRHIAILVGPEGSTLERLSTTNPVRVNGTEADNQRLYDGDEISFNPYVLRLVSERAVDQRPQEEATPPPPLPPGDASPPNLRERASGTQVALGPGRCLIGRSPEAQLQLSSKYVSREHAEVSYDGHLFHVAPVKAGHPVKVNGEEIIGAVRLYAGDVIGIEEHDILFLSPRPVDQPGGEDDKTIQRGRSGEEDNKTLMRGAEGNREESATILLSGRESQAAELGTRLILSRPGKPDTTHPLTTARVMVGRGEGCQLRVDEPSVSRQHFVVEKREDGFFCIPIAGSNPVKINGKKSHEARLYHGDRIQAGKMTFSFVSDRVEDERPPEMKVVVEKSGPPKGVWVSLVVVLLGLGGYLAYDRLVVPWRLEGTLKEAEFLLESGRHDKALELLDALRLGNPPPAVASQAMRLLTRSTVERSQVLVEEQKLPAAKKMLVAFLRDHGATRESEPAWNLLDQVQFALGQKQEADGNPQAAMQEYLSIRVQSPLYGQAQQSISQLWLSYQQQRMKARQPTSARGERNEGVAGLLRRAEENFLAKRYLTPADNNAYTLYRMVLERDPGNTVALARIEDIKAFYRRAGEAQLAKGETAKAIEYFQRYLVVDPGDPEIREKLKQVKEGRGRPQPAAGKPAPPAEAAASQERVRQMLEEQGVESNWIMEYLFEGNGNSGSAESENPW